MASGCWLALKGSEQQSTSERSRARLPAASSREAAAVASASASWSTPPRSRRKRQACSRCSRPARRALRGHRCACPASEQPLVKLCPHRLWHSLVGGVTDQKVTESEGVVAGKSRLIRPDDVLADERHEARGHVGPVGSECGHSTAMEELASIDPRSSTWRSPSSSGPAERRGGPGSSVGWTRRTRDSNSGCPSPPSTTDFQPPRRGPVHEGQGSQPASKEKARNELIGLVAVERLEKNRRRIQLPAAQLDCRSSSSGRAMQNNRIGAPRLRSVTYSTSSRNVPFPNGCRQRRRRAASPRRLARTACGQPRRSRLMKLQWLPAQAP